MKKIAKQAKSPHHSITAITTQQLAAVAGGHNGTIIVENLTGVGGTGLVGVGGTGFTGISGGASD